MYLPLGKIVSTLARTVFKPFLTLLAPQMILYLLLPSLTMHLCKWVLEIGSQSQTSTITKCFVMSLLKSMFVSDFIQFNKSFCGQIIPVARLNVFSKLNIFIPTNLS